jgi:hypothetical protein
MVEMVDIRVIVQVFALIRRQATWQQQLCKCHVLDKFVNFSFPEADQVVTDLLVDVDTLIIDVSLVQADTFVVVVVLL